MTITIWAEIKTTLVLLERAVSRSFQGGECSFNFRLCSMRPLQIALPALAMLGIVASCSSCSPAYVLRGAYEETKILLKRRDIDTVLGDPTTTAQERVKLEIVKAARSFSFELGLAPGRSFTKYTRIDKDVLTWVVVGCRPDSFTLVTWWYPIVGRFPYKGYFEKADAEGEARSLEAAGYETWVRGSEAFSTLGWFNDPVLTPTLKQPEYRIAETVIHETVHRTVWIPDQVAFNESLANFVGAQGALQFFERALQACGADAQCAARQSRLRDAARAAAENEFKIAAVVESLYADLQQLYESGAAREEKLARRQVIFKQHIGPLRAEIPNLSILHSVNNAEIVQLVLYMTQLGEFAGLHRALKGDWRAFIDKMREIAQIVKNDSNADPFVELRRIAADAATR